MLPRTHLPLRGLLPRGDHFRPIVLIAEVVSRSIQSVAKDRFHDIVKTALVKDGWTVTHDPFDLKAGGVEMEIDLGAERLLAAERQNEKIAVEVKSFLASSSTISEFHRALGQFINYRVALKIVDPERL